MIRLHCGMMITLTFYLLSLIIPMWYELGMQLNNMAIIYFDVELN